METINQSSVPILDEQKVKTASAKFPKPPDKVFQYGTAGVSDVLFPSAPKSG